MSAAIIATSVMAISNVRAPHPQHNQHQAQHSAHHRPRDSQLAVFHGRNDTAPRTKKPATKGGLPLQLLPPPRYSEARDASHGAWAGNGSLVSLKDAGNGDRMSAV